MRIVTPFLGLICLAACSDVMGVDGRVDWDHTVADFRDTDPGWIPDFTDYPPGWAETMELDSGHSSLPAPLSGQGFYLSGFNHSDDLFMYLRNRLNGLVPEQRYAAHIQVEYVTGWGQGCVGIGGSPGESVYLKAGITTSEPEPVVVDRGDAGKYVVLSVDKGGQATIGDDATHLGTIGREGAGCDGTTWGHAVRWNEEPFEFHADADGSAWIYVGTDSGFEGRTKIYYTRIAVELVPL